MAKINNFKEGIKRSNQVINDIRITKQGFSKARRKVSPKAFIHLLNEVNK